MININTYFHKDIDITVTKYIQLSVLLGDINNRCAIEDSLLKKTQSNRFIGFFPVNT